jgi:ArsR family transcriptional regulator, arsenate/arsenite/antimonite-responsive transcriptional repressor
VNREQALQAFSALAHPDRLDLIKRLVAQGPEGLAAGQIGAALGGLSASRLSFHLAALEGAGLITSRKVARNVIYTARTEALGGLLAFLLHDCCAGHAHVMECCKRAVPQGQGAAGTEST